MTDKRKTIRITIPAESVALFENAKAKAEEAAMIKLTDTQYASRLIVKALSSDDKMDEILKAVITVLGTNICNNDNQIIADPESLGLLERSVQGVSFKWRNDKLSL